MKISALSVPGFLLCASICLAATHDDSFSKEGLYKADITSVADPEMIAHPALPLNAGHDVVWCATLQLAWNEAIGLVGEKLCFNRELSEVALLNQMDFTRSDLDPKSYVALADFERNHIEDKIRAALEKKFGGAASPELIPPVPKNPGPYDFVAYAYLYKNLAFATPFADLHPLTFAGKPVACFGFDGDSHLPPQAIKQVRIYDYQSPDDFIVELKTKAPDDQLILAMVPPKPTLQETMQGVLERMTNHPATSAGPGDILEVPKLNFDLRKDYTELEGMVLLPSAESKIKENLVVTLVRQLVRFQLNEKGAILKSEAVIAMRALALRIEHPMIFNRPFLLMMKQKNSAQPYLALWIGDPTLLVPAKAN